MKNRIWVVWLLLTLPAAAQDSLPLARSFQAYIRLARPLFVGERDLSSGTTAVHARLPGTVTRENLHSVRRPADDKGGIGTAYVRFTLDRRVDGPLQDFRWHQEELLPWLEKRIQDNQRAARALLDLREEMTALGARSAGEQVRALEGIIGPGWLPHIAGEMRDALEKGDTESAKAWRHEADAALEAQADLHRWTEFLLANQIFALSLQAQTAPLFEQMDPMYRERLPYKANSHIGRFPAGEMTLYHADNYLELERRGEQLFHMPESWPALVRAHPQDQPLPPNLRRSFRKIRDTLPESHQALLDLAARSPYEQSFLIATLHKANAVNRLDALGTVLRRYADRHPQPRLEDMMDVIHDRAGGWFCGLEWGDRYHPTLLEVAAAAPADRMDCAWKAHAWVREHTRDTQGFVFTLREAIDSGAFDCIRSTDAMGSMYRNAGLPGFLFIRLSRGGSGHSISALRLENGSIHFLDGQVGNGAPGIWPRDFREPLKPHPAYAVELLGRGLDSWIFLEGYLVFGPAAGNHVRAPVPYLEGYEKPVVNPREVPAP